MMRKSFFALVTLLAIASGSAKAQVKWNVKAQAGTSLYIGQTDTRGLWSYGIGGGADISLSRHWAVQPSLRFSARGSRFDGYYGYEQIMESTFRQRLYYLDLPVMMACKIRLGEETELHLRMGPYIGCGIGGRTRVSVDNTGDTHKIAGNPFAGGTGLDGMAYDSDKHPMTLPKLRRVDAGLAYGVTLRHRHLLIGAECAGSITPLCRDTFAGGDAGNLIMSLLWGDKPRSLSFGLSVGWEW